MQLGTQTGELCSKGCKRAYQCWILNIPTDASVCLPKYNDNGTEYIYIPQYSHLFAGIMPNPIPSHDLHCRVLLAVLLALLAFDLSAGKSPGFRSSQRLLFCVRSCFLPLLALPPVAPFALLQAPQSSQ